ncbi:ribosomal-protein-alanine N-acetyltransferase [Anaerospora hongkongensis]|uniref:[Ribosomal protein bS18]-alanine N-acetyltransferase n=1 Tax=Anaerospora hongkongensis TaxID=244830 RepID=A0A4R1Q0I6_9FIRM|nr:ribosomal protein S18-alanine N-acetyltransferase [Anaerospora hongkongensis]TCL39181.1 ribosomal-protein-alanine N-acetyltransferase [Anaerospora hongkongensis]
MDVDAVLKVENEAFTTPWSRAAFEAETSDNELAYYLVVDVGGVIAGYAGMWLIIDEAHVTNIALAAAYRGAGLGEQLVRALMELARERGAVSMTLEVRVSNVKAQALYTKLGFVSRGKRRNYYTDNREDALIMWCEL